MPLKNECTGRYSENSWEYPRIEISCSVGVRWYFGINKNPLSFSVHLFLVLLLQYSFSILFLMPPKIKPFIKKAIPELVLQFKNHISMNTQRSYYIQKRYGACHSLVVFEICLMGMRVVLPMWIEPQVPHWQQTFFENLREFANMHHPMRKHLFF